MVVAQQLDGEATTHKENAMSKKIMSLKAAALLASATLTMGVLGFISPASAVVDCTKATTSNNDCTVLTVNTFGDVIQPLLVAEYRKLRPDIKLSIKKSDLDALNGTGLFTQCAANGAGNPDIAAVEISYSGFWRAYPQCFIDLRTLKNRDNKSANDIKKDYLPWRWEHGVGYNDSVIGIPTDVGGLEVAYRWDLFKKAGLPYQRDAVSKEWSTWSKFIAFGKKYVAKLTPAQRKANIGFIDNIGTIYPAVMNQGTEKYYRNNGTDQGQLIYKTNKQVKLAFDTTIAASDAKIGTRIGQFSSDWNVGMTKGTFAAMLAPAWMMDYIKGQAPTTRGKWDIAEVPGGGGNMGGSQLSIPKGAKNKDEAWNFISWYLAPAQQLKVFQTYGLFPSTPSLYNNVDLIGFKDPFFNNAPVGKIYADGVKKLKPIFEGKLQRCIDMAMGSAISLVANGKEKVPSKAFATGIAAAGKCK
jgi:cellobiose transport system substrate-binding protein